MLWESQVQALAPPAVRVGSGSQHCCPQGSRAHAQRCSGQQPFRPQMLVEETEAERLLKNGVCGRDFGHVLSTSTCMCESRSK